MIPRHDPARCQIPDCQACANHAKAVQFAIRSLDKRFSVPPNPRAEAIGAQLFNAFHNVPADYRPFGVPVREK